MFRADMLVEIHNDGPVTILLDSQQELLRDGKDGEETEKMMRVTCMPSGPLGVNTYLVVDEETTGKGFIVDPGGYNPETD